MTTETDFELPNDEQTRCSSHCSPAITAMERFLRELGARPSRPKERMLWVLDGFSADCYLAFDLQPDPEQPDEIGTVDLYVAKPGSHPMDSEDRLRVAVNLRRHGVMRFLFAMGVSQFGEKTKKALHEMNHVLRTQ
ncbi:hypothetical protein V7x_28560 [Crateriforma conspicua]|uniref:Uncharacterized protein n=1 Tax=Crateriforma conspicua TaxID=2527996 RepID=A0A5C6FVY7_9PLAN|nr:hypothetical protein [Crateriforma conspicua]TWU67282.1 hypothetical protein V7x_28560 [Crateriforma conspicua]